MQKDIKVAFLLSVMAMGAGLIALAISPLVDNDPLIHGGGVITLIVGAIGGIAVIYTANPNLNLFSNHPSEQLLDPIAFLSVIDQRRGRMAMSQRDAHAIGYGRD